MPSTFFSRWRLLLLVLALCAVVLARNKETSSDPSGSLLVSESILTRGTIKLDAYGPELLDYLTYRIQRKNGHAYYYFPQGTSILATPVVGLFLLAGRSGLEINREGQVLIAAIIAVLLLATLMRTADLLLPRPAATAAASVMWFGTSFASTGGTALWSHDFAVLFAALAIHRTVLAHKRAPGTEDAKDGWIIGVCLFLAYFCRPTMSLLTVFMLPWLFAIRWRLAVKTGLTVGALLVGFAAMSQWEFGQWLPDYYLPQRLAGDEFTRALAANLVSPARGLLVYSPFLVVLALAWPSRSRAWPLGYAWLPVAVLWPLAHLTVISKFPQWWAGYSYGPRLMMDVLPGLYLVVLRLWPVEFKWRAQPVRLSLVGLSCFFAVVVHTGQGLFNPWIARWNAEPSVDEHHELVFDWRYPQFAAYRRGHEKRLRRMAAASAATR